MTAAGGLQRANEKPQQTAHDPEHHRRAGQHNHRPDHDQGNQAEPDGFNRAQPIIGPAANNRPHASGEIGDDRKDQHFGLG